MGGKRGGRRQIADLGRDLAEWDLRGQRLEVLAGTAKSFVEVLAGQDRVRQAEELESLAARVLAAVAARVEAGKVPPIEATRARVERAAAATVLFKARRELASSRLRLSAFWGETNPRFTRVIGDLSAIPEIPAESVIASRVENNPGVARWGSEFAQLQVALTLARAQAIPDVTVSLGVRHFQETGDNALIAGLSLPIPLFDRNQGGVGAAQATLAKARHQRQAAVTEVQAALGTAWHQLVAAQAEAKTLRDEIVPGAESAFEAARFGYEEGKFDFLTMLDAQRTLFEVRGQYLQVLLTLHQTRIEVERLIGFPLHDLHARAQSSHPNEVTP